MPHHLTTHGQSNTRLYGTWGGMKCRCLNPKDKDFESYGGRGIKICDEWRDFTVFRQWATSSGYRRGLTIERKDVNGNYEPANCCWIPMTHQAKNKRITVYLEAFGERKTLGQWLDDPRCKVGEKTLRGRLFKGWSHEKSLAFVPRKLNQSVASEDGGEARSISEWSKQETSKASPGAIRNRLKLGWSLLKAVSTPHFKHRYRITLEAFGEAKTLSEWLKDHRCKATAKAIRRRIDEGWIAEDAISTPPRPMKRRPR